MISIYIPMFPEEEGNNAMLYTYSYTLGEIYSNVSPKSCNNYITVSPDESNNAMFPPGERNIACLHALFHDPSLLSIG